MSSMTDKESSSRAQQPQQQEGKQQTSAAPAGTNPDAGRAKLPAEQPVPARQTPAAMPAAPGSSSSGPLAAPAESISVTVAPFTGGPFSISVSRRDSVEELKKAVAKKLKVLKDRICLLYRER